MGKNKVKFKLKKAAYAPATITEDGTVAYETPIIMPGAVSIALSPEGDTNTVKADGIDYYVANSNNGYSGDLEMVLLPEEFLKYALGEIETNDDKVLVETTKSEPKPFALLFDFDANVKAIHNVMYLCYASRYAIEGENPDSQEGKYEKVTIKAVPRADGYVKAKTGAETAANVETGWYSSVYEPTQDNE